MAKPDPFGVNFPVDHGAIIFRAASGAALSPRRPRRLEYAAGERTSCAPE
jgi:hypothetical protein